MIKIKLKIPKKYCHSKILKPQFLKIAKSYADAANERIKQYCEVLSIWEDELINGTGEGEPVGLFGNENNASRD